MTIVAKNEEAIIEQQIRFHKEMGVDGFIVLDHNSTDKTPQILKTLQEEGIVLQIITKKEKEHKRHIFVQEMIKLAKEKYGAKWVINADADEFYFSQSLDLKKSIEKEGDVNALLINSRFVFPDDRKNFLSTPYFVTKPLLDFEIFTQDIDTKFVYISEASIRCTKIIHNTKDFIKIADGNHSVKMKNQKMTVSSDIVFYHYHIKNYQEFEAKIKRWEEALKHTFKKGVSKHLKRNLEFYKKGKLKETYENMYGEKEREKLMQLGVVSIDLSVYNFLKWKKII